MQQLIYSKTKKYGMTHVTPYNRSLASMLTLQFRYDKHVKLPVS